MPERGEATPGPALARRQRILLVVALIAAVVSVAGLGASVLIKSPEQLAAEAAGPPASVLTAEVERKVLRQTVVLRGQVSGGQVLEVTPSPAGAGASKAILTAIRLQPGSPVQHGAVVLEVSGRPLIALRGSVPAYRDLRPGAKGPDVRQLQSALRELGHASAETDGVFGPGTKRAVTELYDQLGFEPVTTGESTQSTIDSGRRAVRDAERAAADAKEQVARLQREGAAPEALAAARKAKSRADEDLQDARDSLASLEHTTGTMLPLAEYVFLPAFPSRVDKVGAAIGAEFKAPLVTISSGDLVARGTISQAQRGLLKSDLPVEIVSEITGLSARGKIGSIGEPTAQGQSGTVGYPVTVIAQEPLDSRLAGQDVRLTVEAASTGDQVLAVPLSAVFATADGAAAVLTQTSDGATHRVAVRVGTTGDGYVAVTPIVGTLAPGNRVVIGGERGQHGGGR